MAAIVRTQLQQKAINKVTGVMQDYPLGIEFGELMQKTGYKKSALYNVLSMVGASKSNEGLWHLPHRNDAPVNEATEDDLDDVATSIEQPVMQETAGSLQDDTENMQKGDSSTQDKPANMQDGELNTQAPQVSSPGNDGATLINTPASLVNTSAEVVNPSVSKINMGDYSVNDIDTDADQSSNGQAIETAPVAESSENEVQTVEVSQTPITHFSFIDVLKKSASSILTQDNLATANPAYCVKERTRHFGIDEDYQNDGYEWFCREDQEGFTYDDEMHDALNIIADYLSCDLVKVNGKEYEKCYYRDEERTVTVCFTREQAQDFINANAHNLKNPFIYVESFNRNPEMLAVRQLLICLAENQTMFDAVMVTEGEVFGTA